RKRATFVTPYESPVSIYPTAARCEHRRFAPRGEATAASCAVRLHRRGCRGRVDVARELPRVRYHYTPPPLCGCDPSVRFANDSTWHFAFDAGDPCACWKLPAHVSAWRRSGRARCWRSRYHMYALDTLGLSPGGCCSRIGRTGVVPALSGRWA